MILNDLQVYNDQYKDLHENPYISYTDRIKILKKIRILIMENINKIYEALKLDLNKHENESYFSEVALVLKEVNLFIKKLKGWMKGKRVSTPLTLSWGKSSIIPQARGLCLIISPWNYPFYLTFMPIISSIAAGNRSIVKTSEYSVNTTKLLKKLINQELNSQHIYVMNEDVDSIKSMLKNRFDFVYFTGSEKTGTAISQQISHFHTPSVLEMGGKCPVIIHPDADFNYAVDKIFDAKCVNAGQTCIAPDYVLIPKGKSNIFIEKFNKKSELIESNLNEYPKIITELHFQRLTSLAPLGSHIIDNEHKIIPVSFESDWTKKEMQTEIFGPLLPVIEYDNINEVYKTIFAKNEPLATYIFTKSKQNINHAFKSLRTGSIVVNDLLVSLLNDKLPFGGVGSSGNGRAHGYQGFLTFSNLVSSYVRKSFSTSLSAHPYTDSKLKWIKRLLK
ncbi:aldehyde dehydrogenase family protein [Mycoplasma simbae]|uniref:aldehyde dehydrogenase family protein n=1 Tax=Mycoplasma simbae TaxID=36744 RepID=UPI000690AB27|nr:aldehyde dehydrogenase family protein [Mycoplasma simbae]